MEAVQSGTNSTNLRSKRSKTWQDELFSYWISVTSESIRIGFRGKKWGRQKQSNEMDHARVNLHDSSITEMKRTHL